jgi:hypothetical protein
MDAACLSPTLNDDSNNNWRLLQKMKRRVLQLHVTFCYSPTLRLSALLRRIFGLKRVAVITNFLAPGAHLKEKAFRLWLGRKPRIRQ